MILYLYIAQGQGQTTPFGTNIDVHRKPLSLGPFVASFKKEKSDFIHIFNDFIYVYSPGARADNPLGTNFWCQQKDLIDLPICCRFKKNCFEVRFYICFFMFYHMYSHGQGQKIHWRQNFDVNRKAFSLCPMLQVSKWSLQNLIL